MKKPPWQAALSPLFKLILKLIRRHKMQDNESDVNPKNESLALIRSAIENPECQPEKLREMLVFMQDLEAHGAKKEFNTAMHAAQMAMPIVVKDAVNSHIGNRYATLDTVSKAIKPIYNRHGFSVSFGEEVCARDGFILVIATVRHIGNHIETYKRFAPIDNLGPKGSPVKTMLHGCQSSMSYMQRQLLCSIFGVTVSDTDDDGNGPDPEPEFITQDQADEIEKYLGNLPDKKRQSVLNFAQCETIESMSAQWYPKVIDNLKASIKKSDDNN